MRRKQRLEPHAHPGERPSLCVKLPPGQFDRLGFVAGAKVEVYPGLQGALVVRLVPEVESHDPFNARHVAHCQRCMRDISLGKVRAQLAPKGQI